MFVDASALVAILVREPEAPEFTSRLDQAENRYTSAIALYEAVLGIARIRGTAIDVAEDAIDEFVAETPLQIIPITSEIGRIAVDAFSRFGRGNHPARLNMGDCFAYACARSLGVPLLCKGGDFTQTDIAIA
jgi:ribonuclease VapC